MSLSSDPPAASAAPEHVLEPTAVPGVHLRRATRADVHGMLALFDGAAAWLNSQGIVGQWGTVEQVRARENREGRFADYADNDVTWVAVANSPSGSSAPASEPDSGDGAAGAGSAEQELQQQQELIIGVIALGEATDYVPPATEPEIFVRLLLTHRGWKGKGLGTLLLEKGREEARNKGVDVMRVDCYAGDEGKLVKWYESQGFQKQVSVMVKGTWPGQVLIQRL